MLAVWAGRGAQAASRLAIDWQLRREPDGKFIGRAWALQAVNDIGTIVYFEKGKELIGETEGKVLKVSNPRFSEKFTKLHMAKLRQCIWEAH